MSATSERLGRLGAVALALFLMGQWWCVHFFAHPGAVLVAISAGVGIFGAAFALSWAAEVAQLDIPEALSLAFLALIAVLPEYAVDIYFAWQAGKDPAYIQYAAANMTGANRILIGAGWPIVVFAFWAKSRVLEIRLVDQQKTELYYLLAATLYSLVIPLKGALTVVDSVVLVLLFVGYIVAAARAGMEEPELDGPAEMIAELSPAARRLATGGLFAVAGATIFIAAEPFAESLLEIGAVFGIDEFLLVQWIAPLASESPEFIVAVLFALRLKPTSGFSALVSSKVNQWTLLIGMLPLAFSLSAGGLAPMTLETRQAHEILLTSAQSLFAIVILIDMRFHMLEAIALLVLFSVQLAWPDPVVRMAFVWIYFGGAVGLLVFHRPRRAAMLALMRRRPFSARG